MIRASLVSILLALLAAGSACKPKIGDACEQRADCPSGAVCDTTVPDGYCTIPDCVPGGCPDEAVCVEFDRETAYCLRYCTSNKQCRDGYTCRDDIGDRKFCYVPDG